MRLTAIIEAPADMSRPEVNRRLARAGLILQSVTYHQQGRPLTIDRIQVRKLSAEGLSSREVARRLKCSAAAVQKILQAAGG